MQPAETPTDSPALYEIRVEGALDPSWSESLEGMTVAVTWDADHPPVTVLRGMLADQTCLCNVLSILFGLSVSVISVEAIQLK